MPRLPSAADLGERPVARPASRSGSYRVIPAPDISPALTAIGARAAEKQDRSDYAEARSAFLRTKIETDSAFDEDQDWQTYEERYTERMTAAREAAAKAIGNPAARRQFIAESEVDLARGVAGIRTKARGREVDEGRGKLAGLLNSNLDAALATDDEPTRIGLIQSSQDAIESAAVRGYISPLEAETQRKGFVDSYKKRRDEQIRTGIADRVDELRNAVLRSPGEVAPALQEIEQKIASSGLSAADRQKETLLARRGLALSAAQGEIQANPQAALTRLRAGAFDKDLDADNKARLIDAAQGRVDTLRREFLADRDRAERIAERDLRKAQTANEAALFGEVSGGRRLSEEELGGLVRQQRITPEAANAIRAQQARVENGTDNARVVVSLTDRMVRNGEDIHDDAMREYVNGNLSRDTLLSLTKDNEQRKTQAGKEQWKTAEEREQFDFVSRYLGRDKLQFSFDDMTAARLALAQREYRDRVGAGEAPREVANDIVARFAHNVVAPPSPSRYVDTPTSRAQIGPAVQRINSLLAARLISREVAAEELRSLKALEDQLPPEPPRKTGKAGEKVR